MKSIFKILVVLLAVGSLMQTVASAKGKIGDSSGGVKVKGKGTGPGI